jgi:hypothetical protein
MAKTVLLKYQTVVGARSGHLCAFVWKAFSLLRFFVAVGQRNEVPPRTVANSAKEVSKNGTREGPNSSNPAATQHQPRPPPIKRPAPGL